MTVPLNIPNILTIARILLIPVFAFYAMQGNYKIAVIVFIVEEVTDILDGYIARKTGQTSDFGKLFDPVADKMLQVTAIIIFAVQSKIPWIFPIILVAKEFSMMIGGLVFFKKKVVVSSKWYGKVASMLFFVAILMALFNIPGLIYAMWVALTFTLFAMTRYAIYFNNITNRIQ